MKKTAFCSLALIALSGCATIFDGTTQTITINTNPSGADCTLNRNGAVIGHVSPTPASMNIEKTKDDITILCNKFGFEQATYLNHSGVAGATYADIIGGGLGLIGWGIDSSTGSDNKYDSPVNMTLVPEQTSMPMQAPPTMSPSAPPAVPSAMQPLTPVPPHAVQP